MRTLEGSDRVRNGLMGILILLLVIGVGQSFASVPVLFAEPTYYAQFSDTGGLSGGDKVRIAGVDVGEVRSMEIDGDKVKIGYTLGGTQIGTDSRAAIRTDTILGRKNMEIEPRGTEVLRANGVLPLGQTTTPYQIYDAFFDVTKAASGWDTETVKRSLNVLSETIDQTYPHLSAALDGVARFSDTIGKRDEQIKELLANANKIAGVLGNRSEQINALLTNAQSLLGAINERTYAVSMLLERVGSVLGTGHWLHQRQPQPQPCAGTAADHQRHPQGAQVRLGRHAVNAGQVHRVAGRGGSVRPLLQGDAGQPPAAVAAATVRRLRVQEARHRPGGVLAQRRSALLAVPRPERHAVPERCSRAGTGCAGRHTGESGTRSGRGSPMLVHAHGRDAAAAGDPLPCSHLSTGPFGPNPYSNRAARATTLPDVITSPPNPNGPGFTPGVPAAAIPGQLPPDMGGAPAPLPPAPPGARTVPVGPLPPEGPDFTPGIAPLPPALEGPPPPPGPGPEPAPAGTPLLPGQPAVPSTWFAERLGPKQCRLSSTCET